MGAAQHFEDEYVARLRDDDSGWTETDSRVASELIRTDGDLEEEKVSLEPISGMRESGGESAHRAGSRRTGV